MRVFSALPALVTASHTCLSSTCKVEVRLKKLDYCIVLFSLMAA